MSLRHLFSSTLAVAIGIIGSIVLLLVTLSSPAVVQSDGNKSALDLNHELIAKSLPELITKSLPSIAEAQLVVGKPTLDLSHKPLVKDSTSTAAVLAAHSPISLPAPVSRATIPPTHSLSLPYRPDTSVPGGVARSSAAYLSGKPHTMGYAGNPAGAPVPLTLEPQGFTEPTNLSTRINAMDDGRVVVRWLAQSDGSVPLAAMEQVVADFNASQTAISLTLETVPSANLQQTLQTQIDANDPPDIVGMFGGAFGNSFHGQWLDLSSLISTTGYILTDYYTQPLGLYQENGEFLGLPLLIYPSYIYYNKDLFDAAGLAYPPHQYGQPYTDSTYGGDWTIDKLAEIARLLTLDNNSRIATDPSFDAGSIVQFGYLTQWTDARGEATLFGADSFMNASGNAQIPDNWRTGFHWYYDALWGSQPFVPNGPYEYGNLGGNAFDSGHVAMAHSHLWYYTCCLSHIPNWDIAATPAYSGTATSKMHTDGLRIIQATQHPTEAFQALTYIVGDGAPTLVDGITNGFPARISLQSDARTDLEATYPDVDWQVMIDSIDYVDNPSHESYLPNFQIATNRINEFYDLYHGAPGLDLDAELGLLREDLQAIFDGQIKTVTPQGKVNYGDTLTYTVFLSATPGVEFGLYDPLTNTTFVSFVEQPTGIVYEDGAITGTFIATSTQYATISFVVQVDVPTLPATQLINRACMYDLSETLDECQWTNRVYNALPTPEVGMSKSNVGGFARPGGVYVYSIVYWNDGNGEAQNTIITDTLPMFTSYAGDTSGFTHDIGAEGVITWNLGTLPPPGNNDNWGVFAVTLNVSDTVPTGSGSLSANCAVISTTSPGDTKLGNESSCSEPVNVQDSDVGVSVDKWPNTNDPAPGQEFDYTIQWCTDSGANFGPVWLTDTLPVSTTFVSWSTDWPWNLWTDVITTGGQFALYAPGLPGNYCQQTYLRLRVDPDAEVGTLLQNTVVITTPGDVNPNNNQEINTDAHVGLTRYDLYLNKNTNSGQMVPGGSINYHINYHNQGNTATHAWVTDTLPPGATYQPGSANEQNGGPAFPPADVTSDYVVWDLGVLGVNQDYGFDFSIDISDAVAPTTALTNCATIGLAVPDDTPWDNSSCVAETIYNHGPNLRVIKQSNWQNNYGQLRYDVQFLNIGDQQIDNVVLTDTLPTGTTYGDRWNVDFDRSRFSDVSQSGSLLTWTISTLYAGDSGWLHYEANLDSPGARPSWYTNTIEIDAPSGEVNPADNRDMTVDVSGEVNRVELQIANRIEMWGQAEPNSPLTITTAYTEVTTSVGGDGNWNIYQEGSPIGPGDTVTVTAGNGTLPVVIDVPAPFDVQVDSITDRVWGRIDSLDHQSIHVDLCSDTGCLFTFAQTDSSGYFTHTLADVPRGGKAIVRYGTTIDSAEVVFHRLVQSPDLILRVNYGHDWVGADYDAGHTIWLTVTNGGGVVRATAALSTTSMSTWGQPGFETIASDWSPVPPDIEAGDWVYGQVDNGYTSTVHVGTITGNVNSASDTISGTITANWFTQPLDVRCQVWTMGAPDWMRTTADPNGGSYECHFADWDLLLGQDVAVRYFEPGGDSIFNVFHELAARLNIDTWGNNQPGEGGNYALTINYDNRGDASAADTVITSSLEGMTYLSDNSGYPSFATGSVITWNVGTVPAAGSNQFDVFVRVDAPSGDNITNTVEIGTPSLDLTDNARKIASWSGTVRANATHLNIDKSAWTNDPAPGYDTVFTLNPCNNGSTASSQITITDTLHPSMTVQSWWGQYPGWTEVFSDAHTLAVSYLTIPGGQCSQVYLRAHLDESAWQGMSISNTAVITASNDLEDNNNQGTWSGNVNNPHTDLSIDKNWSWGELVAGGEVHYNINYNNGGNVPVTSTIRITDTFPVSTTFNTWNFGGWSGITLTELTANYAVWELNGLDNGYKDGFEVVLNVASEASAGTVLTNTVEISQLPDEDRIDNNTSTVTEMVFDHGPNLRVSGRHDEGQWNGNRNLNYDIRFENVGDVRANSIWLTDTRPLATSFGSGGSCQLNYGSRIIDSTDTGEVRAWEFEYLDPGEAGSFWCQVNRDDDLRPRWYTNTVEITTPSDDANPSDNSATDTVVNGEVNRVELRVGVSRIDMWGQAQPNSLITITTPYTEVTTTVDGNGNWGVNPEGSSIQPGDAVTVTAGSGTLPVVIDVPTPFDVQADSVTDRVWGRIDSLDHQLVEVQPNNWPAPKTVQTDNNGNYLAVFTDIPRGGSGEVRYNTTIDSAQVVFHHDFQSPDLMLTANYGDDWVETNYDAGHTIWITVTNDVGAVKATMIDTTTVVLGWNGATGFFTNMGTWLPSRPDIVVGDWVYGAIDTGYTASVQIGALTGNVHTASDSITGTVTATWFTPMLNAQCWVDGAGGTNQRFMVDPSGGNYACHFASFDLKPENSVSVQYQEPDGDWVRSSFYEPAAHLNMITGGNNQPGAGGNYALTVRYDNQGDAPAADTIITSTLEGMTYLSDGSGYPALVTGGRVITWNVGIVPANSSNEFDVFVHVDTAPNENITNTVGISTTSLDRTDGVSKNAAWSGTVQASNVDVNVSGRPLTGQPAPGYDYIYDVYVCNNGSTGTTEVLLTNTLPLSTSLVNWWSQNPGWSQVLSDTHQLIVSRPILTGGQCEQVFVRVYLDPAAMQGDSLYYMALVGASNDSNTGNNQMDLWNNVGGPYYDLNISKNWNWGQLVPGGEVRYNINYNNNASLPITTTIRITDTLPQSTTFLGAWYYDQQGPHPVTPTITGTGYVAWDIPSLENGFGSNFEVALRLDSGMTPGTVFTNCATIAADVAEYNNPYDNAQCVADTVRASGPNLRVTKTADWQNIGRQIQYRVRLENIGTTSISSVTLTDTYPASMTLNWWGWDINRQPWQANNDALNHVFTVTLDSPFNPGQTADLNLQFDVPGVPNGTFFTNTAEITTPPGDVNPADNLVQQVSATGPDLSVEKWLTGGSTTPVPGDLLTYTLHLANKSTGWGTSGQILITDTLPAGLEFIAAQQRLCGPGNFFCNSTPSQSGSVLAWTWGPWCSNCWNDLIVEARVLGTAQPGEVLTNTVEIASDNPSMDVEPDYMNNSSAVSVRAMNAHFVVDKVYESTRVAGTVVTYTLTVTNQGDYIGTNVLLVDQLPISVTYGGGSGTYASGWTTWTLPSLAPFGGTAERWFSGTLGCAVSSTVTNEEYRVDGSDQNVTSTNGSPVSFTIIAPTIDAAITHDPDPIAVGDTMHFTATASTNGTPLSYAWNFGDGSGASGLMASRVYTQGGTYTATFTATDACDITNVQTNTITVLNPAVGLSPAVSTRGSAGAIATYTLVLTNTGLAANTFSFTGTNSLAGWTISVPVPLMLNAGVSANVVVTVSILAAATNNITDTAAFTVTAPGLTSAVAALVTGTGCRFDFDTSGRITLTDVSRLTTRFNVAPPNPLYNLFYDFDHSGRITLSDVSRLTTRFNMYCPK